MKPKVKIGYYYCNDCKRVIMIAKGTKFKCMHCGSKNLRFVSMNTL